MGKSRRRCKVSEVVSGRSLMNAGGGRAAAAAAAASSGCGRCGSASAMNLVCTDSRCASSERLQPICSACHYVVGHSSASLETYLQQMEVILSDAFNVLDEDFNALSAFCFHLNELSFLIDTLKTKTFGKLTLQAKQKENLDRCVQSMRGMREELSLAGVNYCAGGIIESQEETFRKVKEIMVFDENAENNDNILRPSLILTGGFLAKCQALLLGRVRDIFGGDSDEAADEFRRHKEEAEEAVCLVNQHEPTKREDKVVKILVAEPVAAAAAAAAAAMGIQGKNGGRKFEKKRKNSVKPHSLNDNFNPRDSTFSVVSDEEEGRGGEPQQPSRQKRPRELDVVIIDEESSQEKGMDCDGDDGGNGDGGGGGVNRFARANNLEESNSDSEESYSDDHSKKESRRKSHSEDGGGGGGGVQLHQSHGEESGTLRRIRQLSTQEKFQILEEYDRIGDIRLISDKYFIKYRRLYNFIQNSRGPNNQSIRQYSDEDKTLIYNDFLASKNVREVANKWKLNYDSLYSFIRYKKHK